MNIDIFIENFDFWQCFNDNYNFISDFIIEDGTDMEFIRIKSATEETEKNIYGEYINYVKQYLIECINKIINKDIKGELCSFIDRINYEYYSFKNYIESYVEGMLEPDFDEGYSSHEEDNILHSDSYCSSMDTITEIFDR